MILLVDNEPDITLVFNIGRRSWFAVDIFENPQLALSDTYRSR